MTAIAKDLVDEALEAFKVDASYAVAIARMAVVIIKKRSSWQSRQVEQQGLSGGQAAGAVLRTSLP